MKKLLYTLALLVSLKSFGQEVFYSEGSTSVNLQNLNKRELKSYLQQASNSILYLAGEKVSLNNKIIDLENDIRATKSQLIVSNEELTRLNGLNTVQANKVTKLTQENSKISILESELSVLKDSILKINDMISRYESQINLNSPQQSTSSNDSFLNDLYLGNDTPANQNFILKPAGIISINNSKFFNNIDNDSYNNKNIGKLFTQFFPISELNFTIEKKIDRNIFGRDVMNWKNVIESNSIKVGGQNFYSSQNNILPKFSFLRGKLLTVTNGNFSKDFLFSVKNYEFSSDDYWQDASYSEEKIFSKFSGQKPLYFSLTDDDEKEYLFGLTVINNEVYLMLNKNDLVTIGWLEISDQYFNTKLFRKDASDERYSYSGYSYDKDFDDPLCTDYSGDNRIFIPCEGEDYKISTDNNGFIVASTKKTLYRDSEIITPLFMLFKLERL